MAPTDNISQEPAPSPTLRFLVILAITLVLSVLLSAFGATVTSADEIPMPEATSQGGGGRHRERSADADAYVQDRRQSFEEELARERRQALQDYLEQNGLPASLLDQLDLMVPVTVTSLVVGGYAMSVRMMRRKAIQQRI